MIKRTKKVIPHIKAHAVNYLKELKKYHGYSEDMEEMIYCDVAVIEGLIRDVETAPNNFFPWIRLYLKDAQLPWPGANEHVPLARSREAIESLASGVFNEEISHLQKEVPTDKKAIKKKFENMIKNLEELLPKKTLHKKINVWLFRERYQLEEYPRTRNLTRACSEFLLFFLKFWYQEIEVRFICRGYSFYGEANEKTYYNSDAKKPKEDKVYIRETVDGDETNLKIKADDMLLFMGYGSEYYSFNLKTLTEMMTRISGYTPLYVYTEIENGFHREMWQAHEELKSEKYPDLIMTYMSEVDHALDWMVPLAEKLNKTLIR